MNQSYLHYRIRYWLHRMRVLGQMDYIHVSSAGIIPFLCVNWYPFNAYDWNNAMADAETLSYMRGRIADHFDRFNARKHYSRRIVYLRGGSNTARALETTSAISQCETVYIDQAMGGTEADQRWVRAHRKILGGDEATSDPDEVLIWPSSLRMLGVGLTNLALEDRRRPAPQLSEDEPDAWMWPEDNTVPRDKF